MRRINYKSDIQPLLLSLKVDENQITVPDCDFIVRFYIDGYEGRHYDCSHIGGVWSNCEPSEDGTKLVCYINNQRLGIGELCAEFHYISPDKRYSDGSQKSVVIIDSTELGVELVEDNGDAVTEAAIDVTLPFIYRTAYEIAIDHGYTGTAEDFYGALASVVGIADAEKKRVTAEITRNANEQERIENEENRLNAESERVNAEAQRVRNEAIRGDAESDRVEQEEDRKAKFEEITGFIATVRANEGNRESNERERQANEDTRITEEAKRVEAEKKRAAEFEQQKLDLAGKIDRSGDEMGGDLIFTDNTGVSFRTSDGGIHTMFNDTDDVAKFTAVNGDTFEFKQNETPNTNSSAVVVSANLYNALDMTLYSMGSALDGDAAYRPEAGDKIFNPNTCKIQRYNSTVGGFEDLCDPVEGKLYANKMTGYIYRWDTKTKKMVFVGGVKAYTKDEADIRFAKLDDATQIVKVKDLDAYNSINAKSMWIGDEGLLLGGDGNGHLTVEQDEVITDVTLNEKLATKADDVAYGVEWNNAQPTGEMQETTVKDATKNTTAFTLILGQSFNALESEVEKKANKTELDTINANVDQKVSKTDIVQNTGQSTTSVMSQKAVSAKLSELKSNDERQNSEINGLRNQVENYKPIVIEGNVTNAADEEDLTSENGLLKIKNRSSLDGMGYVILRKGKTFAEQVTKENTIYEIRYDFDLNGAEITVPENCVLKFNGGSIKGGNITGHILNSYVIPQWFGAIEGDNVIDGTQNNEAFQNCVNICDNVCVPSGTYIFKQIQGNENGGSFRIEKNNTKLFSIGGAVLKFEQNDYNGMTFQSGMVIINNCSDIVIDNIVFEGDELVQTDNSDHNGIIYMVGSTNVSIQNCKFFNVSKDAIFITLSKNVKIDNCIIDTIHRDGMVVESVDGLLVKNVEITNVRDTTYSFAVDIESHHEGRIIKDVVFKDCNFHNIQQGYAIISAAPIVGKCLIDGGYYISIQVNKDSEDVKIRNITANSIVAKGKIDISNSIIEILEFENRNDENKSSIISNCNIGKLQCSTGASINYNVYFNNCVFNMINMDYTTPNKISFIYCIFQDVTEGLNLVANSFIAMYSCLYKSNLERNKNIMIVSNDGIEVVGCSFVFSETTQSQINTGAIMLNSKKVFFENNNISMPKNLNPIYMLNVTQNHNNGGTVTLLNNVFSGLKRNLFSSYGLNNMTLGQTRVLANNTFKDDYVNEDLPPQ